MQINYSEFYLRLPNINRVKLDKTFCIIVHFIRLCKLYVPWQIYGYHIDTTETISFLLFVFLGMLPFFAFLLHFLSCYMLLILLYEYYKRYYKIEDRSCKMHCNKNLRTKTNANVIKIKWIRKMNINKSNILILIDVFV